MLFNNYPCKNRIGITSLFFVNCVCTLYLLRHVRSRYRVLKGILYSYTLWACSFPLQNRETKHSINDVYEEILLYLLSHRTWSPSHRTGLHRLRANPLGRTYHILHGIERGSNIDQSSEPPGLGT